MTAISLSSRDPGKRRHLGLASGVGATRSLDQCGRQFHLAQGAAGDRELAIDVRRGAEVEPSRAITSINFLSVIAGNVASNRRSVVEFGPGSCKQFEFRPLAAKPDAHIT
jgi:hypothetical protein